MKRRGMMDKSAPIGRISLNALACLMIYAHISVNTVFADNSKDLQDSLLGLGVGVAAGVVSGALGEAAKKSEQNDNGSSHAKNDKSSAKEIDMFFALSVNKGNIQTGEDAHAFLKLYLFGGGEYGAKEIEYPVLNFTGFEEESVGELQKGEELVNNKTYHTLTFEYKIRAQTPGVYKIGPAHITFKVVHRPDNVEMSSTLESNCVTVEVLNANSENPSSSFKDNAFVVKGLYLGMDIYEAKSVLDSHLKSGTSIAVPGEMAGVGLGEYGDKYVIAPNNMTYIITAALSDRKILFIDLPPPIVDELFNTSGVDAETFAKEFMDAYNIPKMEPCYDDPVLQTQQLALAELGGYVRGGWQYNDPKEGYKIIIATDKHLYLYPIAKKSEYKFD